MTTAQRVEAGAAVLDYAVPGWRSRVNPDVLDMSDFDRCVLGQLFGDYAEGTRELGHATYSAPHLLGFDIPPSYEGAVGERAYERLNDLWRKQIASR